MCSFNADLVDEAKVVEALSPTTSRKSSKTKRHNKASIHIQSPVPSQQNVSTTSAGNSVANTYELLEAILSFLPFQTLLLFQRVCKLFKDVIADSFKLRQILWLEPMPPPQLIGPLSHIGIHDDNASVEVAYSRRSQTR